MLSRHHLACVPLLVAALVALPSCKKKPPEEQPATKTESTEPAAKTEPGKTEPQAGKPEEKKAAAVVGCQLPATVNSDVTLKAGCALIVSENVTVDQGATLTIQPGAKLSFNPDTYLWIVKGRLSAKGTKDAPITFTSSNKAPAAGDWAGIGFGDNTMADTVLDYVTVEYAGRKSHNMEGAIHMKASNINKRVTITNSTIRKCEQAGVINTGESAEFAKFENNVVSDVPVSLHVAADLLGSVGAGNKVSAPVEASGNVTVTATWPKLDAAIHVAESLRIAGAKGAAILTLAEKTTIKFAMSTFLEIGAEQGGGLVAKEATFTSLNATPAAGDWVGIFIDDKATSTVLESCTIAYAGRDEHNGKGAITFNGGKLGPGVKITKTTFKDINKAAIWGVDGDCGDLAKPASGNTVTGVPLCAPKPE